MTPAEYTSLYKNELLERVLPFWLKHSKDEVYGGYFSCLLEDGRVFDTDKFIWLQARQVWTFSMLYNRLEQKQEWLDFAVHGATFLEQHGRDENAYWYFSLNQQGAPLIQPYNVFSDCFAAMAFGQLFLATGKTKYAEIATSTFRNILKRKDNSKGVYSKVYPGTRPLKNFALPMILCNLCLELESLLDEHLVEQTIQDCIREVMDVFYHEPSGLILENVTSTGAFSDSMDGRLLNPGHAIEAMWFIMDLGERYGDKDLIQRAVNIMLQTLSYGWDDKYGGIFYFMDIKGHPTQQLEWDRKLWWVHLEALLGLLKGYQLTRDERCWSWFEKVHQYTWSCFPDPVHGEWWGHLDRQGERIFNLKGGKWKGCFHVPRALYYCWKILEDV